MKNILRNNMSVISISMQRKCIFLRGNITKNYICNYAQQILTIAGFSSGKAV